MLLRRHATGEGTDDGGIAERAAVVAKDRAAEHRSGPSKLESLRQSGKAIVLWRGKPLFDYETKVNLSLVIQKTSLPEKLIIDLGDDVTINLGDSIDLIAYANLPIDSILWTPEELMEMFNQQNAKTTAQ